MIISEIKVLCFKDVGEKVFPEVVRVEAETWPEEIRAPREKFESRARIFPEGFFLGYADNKLWGVATSQIINFDPANPCTSWEETTDNGWIKKSHTFQGNALYVISVGVSPRASRQGIGTALMIAEKGLAKKLSLGWLVLGSRLPGFATWHQVNPRSSIKDYFDCQNETRESIDPLIRFYQRLGLKIVKIVPNYMEDDPESENFGVVMTWQNSQRTGI